MQLFDKLHEVIGGVYETRVEESKLVNCAIDSLVVVGLVMRMR